MRKIIILGVAALFSVNAHALSDEAMQGEVLYKTCHACHNPNFDPPKAPPMFAVQKQYKRVTANKQAFVDKLVGFTVNPQRDAAVLKHAVETLGLMPPLPIPEPELKKIAAYIYEHEFEYPCAHWQAGMKRAKAEGDMLHYEKDKKKLERFCGDNK